MFSRKSPEPVIVFSSIDKPRPGAPCVTDKKPSRDVPWPRVRDNKRISPQSRASSLPIIWCERELSENRFDALPLSLFFSLPKWLSDRMSSHPPLGSAISHMKMSLKEGVI